MAINSAVSIDYSVWPRLVYIAAPETEVTCQDLYDSLQYLQALAGAMDESPIIQASGKEQLGGGVSVGLTVTLLDALLIFDPRTEPTVCKVNGGNMVSYDTVNQVFLDSPLEYSAFVMPIYTSSSSATQSDLDALQYSSYQNAVWLDIETTNTGTDYPSGTREQPVNNFADAADICALKGFDTIRVLKSAFIPENQNLDNLLIIGTNNTQTVVYIPSSASIANTQFVECYISGTLDSGAVLSGCVTGDISYLNGLLRDCAIQSNMILGGGTSAYLVNCGTTRVEEPPVDFDLGGTGQNLVLRNFQGDCSISNLNDPLMTCSLYFDTGELIIDSTVTAGTIIVRGHVNVIDNSTGTAIVDSSDTMTPENVTNSVWSYNRDA